MEACGHRSNAKKARMESPPSRMVKQEAAGEEEAASGGRALMVLGGDAARLEVVVRMDVDMLHCPICTLPLKPPIFQCGVGHMACGSCHGQLATNKCYSCAGAGAAYAPCPAMDAFFSKILVPCPHEAYGCRASVAYFLVSDHQHDCPCAPCRCSEPGCAFVGSPPMLRDHLRDTHAWPVDKITYGGTHNIWLPEPYPRRLLEAEDDGRVFSLAVGAHGPRLGVTVACVRATAAAGPSYSFRLWATGNLGVETGQAEIAMAAAEVPSSSSVPGPGDAATALAAEAAPLSVRRSMLHGMSMELLLSIMIEKSMN